MYSKPGWRLINCKGRFETCPYETNHIPSPRLSTASPPLAWGRRGLCVTRIVGRGKQRPYDLCQALVKEG